MRCSPDVRMTRSGSGSSGAYRRCASVCSETSSGVDALPHQLLHRVHELRAAPVVERDPEEERVVFRGLVLERRHLALQVLRDPIAAPDEARTDALAREVRELAVDRLVQELEERLHLVGGPRPVLGRECVHRERLDPEVDRRLDRPPERPGAFAVPLGHGDPTCGRPAATAVHDDGDGGDSGPAGRLIRWRGGVFLVWWRDGVGTVVRHQVA